MPTYTYQGNGTISVEGVDGGSQLVRKGESFATYKVMPTNSDFVKTAETPHFPLVSVYEAAFASPGTKTGLLSCKILRLTASGDIVVKANHADNPYPLSLIDGTALDIENHGEIESLVFTGTGTVKIEGF